MGAAVAVAVAVAVAGGGGGVTSFRNSRIDAQRLDGIHLTVVFAFADFANVGSPSEKTLYSLSLSCNGEGVKPAEEEEPVGNGHSEDDAQEQLTATKKPSYLGLACSINGYSGITRYDSKLREGFRSRDSSPGARLIPRDTSPGGFRYVYPRFPVHYYSNQRLSNKSSASH
jgi:hypothetical protein